MKSLAIHHSVPFKNWWLSHPSEEYDLVSWDDEIPNICKNIIQIFQTTKQHFLYCHDVPFSVHHVATL